MIENKAAAITIKSSMKNTIIELLEKAINKEIFDAVIIPMETPAKDSFVYVLVKDKNLLKDSNPLPPVMFVQGAKAVSSITRLGEGNLKIAAILRPCEIRAAIELAKVGQTNLDNITLISMDCPGVLPYPDFLSDPKKYKKLFEEAVEKWDNKLMRPVCQICNHSSMVSGDIHFATLGINKDKMYLIPNSSKGKNLIEKLELPLKENIESWQKKVKEISEKRHGKRKKTHKDLKTKIGGIDNFVDTFSNCINCHNCMRVCPVCFCRLCYFDSDKVKHNSEDYLDRAETKGSLRFLPDTSLFHIGRMSHMSLSCVSCGSCEDACPMAIPVAQVFSMIADETQELFNYVSGRDLKEPIPLVAYKEEELRDMEDAHD